MPAFEYHALDAQGRNKKGVLEGDTPRQVRQLLRDGGLHPLDVQAVTERTPRKNTPWRRRQNLNANELALLTRQVATLLATGAPVAEALHTAARQARNPRIARVLHGVRSRVLEGHGMAVGMNDFPGVFNEIFRATVAAGEQSGHLDAVLGRLADYTEARHALNQRVQQALIYPSFLVVMSIAILAGLLGYVVPKIVQVFANMGQELPWLTRALISLSDLLRHWGLAIVVLLGVGIWLMRRALRNPVLRERWHRTLLRLPLLGGLIRGIETARFARTLSILAASGVPILESLTISAQVVGNLPMRNALQEVAGRVREGDGIAASLERSGYFPPMAVYLIASGEGGGNLEEMLERAAQQQERETSSIIGTALALFEPVMIVVMGLIVFVIVLAILLPIFQLDQLVK
ncbi:MAG: type II secretion system inner membrane protein GspF [Gammaproteobacteria bacterium]|jgi:general secretion pathway protein F